MKSCKSGNKKKSYDGKVKISSKIPRIFFDIACCKCVDFNNCNCLKDKKVPKLEQAFFYWNNKMVGRSSSEK